MARIQRLSDASVSHTLTLLVLLGTLLTLCDAILLFPFTKKEQENSVTQYMCKPQPHNATAVLRKIET